MKPILMYPTSNATQHLYVTENNQIHSYCIQKNMNKTITDATIKLQIPENKKDLLLFNTKHTNFNLCALVFLVKIMDKSNAISVVNFKYICIDHMFFSPKKIDNVHI